MFFREIKDAQTPSFFVYRRVAQRHRGLITAAQRRILDLELPDGSPPIRPRELGSISIRVLTERRVRYSVTAPGSQLAQRTVRDAAHAVGDTMPETTNGPLDVYWSGLTTITQAGRIAIVALVSDRRIARELRTAEAALEDISGVTSPYTEPHPPHITLAQIPIVDGMPITNIIRHIRGARIGGQTVNLDEPICVVNAPTTNFPPPGP